MKKNTKQGGAPLLVMMVLATTLIAAACTPSEHTAVTPPSQEVAGSIDSSRWLFTPISVSPQYGRAQQVNGQYSVIYNKGKIEAYLPYFGRAYSSVDYGNSHSPLDFKSVDVEESKVQRKNDRWDIVIKPRDYREVQSMNFTLYSNGNADLDIVLANRSGIRFTGTVGPLNK